MLSFRTLPTSSAILTVAIALIIFDAPTFPGRSAYAKERSTSSLIESLDHDSYHVRNAAERSLLARQDDPRVRERLIDALHHDSLEVRNRVLSILQRYRVKAFDDQVERLANLECDINAISLPGWKRYIVSAGNDRPARAIFERIIRRFSGTFKAIDQNRRLENFSREFDPYRIDGNDIARWAVLLICDGDDIDHGVRDLSHRISNALCNSGLAPKCKSNDEKTVIKRLVGHWIMSHQNVATPREHLLAAMRYQCHARAGEICSSVFADENATASAQTTAMLVANVLQRSDLKGQLQQRLDDDRTAHVWQLIASRKTKIRTQIRDVALALLLHQHGLDPRQFGFTELQADPLLIFRDHSLGFANDDSRKAAQRRASVVFTK